MDEQLIKRQLREADNAQRGPSINKSGKFRKKTEKRDLPKSTPSQAVLGGDEIVIKRTSKKINYEALIGAFDENGNLKLPNIVANAASSSYINNNNIDDITKFNTMNNAAISNTTAANNAIFNDLYTYMNPITTTSSDINVEDNINEDEAAQLVDNIAVTKKSRKRVQINTNTTNNKSTVLRKGKQLKTNTNSNNADDDCEEEVNNEEEEAEEINMNTKLSKHKINPVKLKVPLKSKSRQTDLSEIHTKINTDSKSTNKKGKEEDENEDDDEEDDEEVEEEEEYDDLIHSSSNRYNNFNEGDYEYEEYD